MAWIENSTLSICASLFGCGKPSKFPHAGCGDRHLFGPSMHIWCKNKFSSVPWKCEAHRYCPEVKAPTVTTAKVCMCRTFIGENWQYLFFLRRRHSSSYTFIHAPMSSLALRLGDNSSFHWPYQSLQKFSLKSTLIFFIFFNTNKHCWVLKRDYQCLIGYNTIEPNYTADLGDLKAYWMVGKKRPTWISIWFDDYQNLIELPPKYSTDQFCSPVYFERSWIQI